MMPERWIIAIILSFVGAFAIVTDESKPNEPTALFGHQLDQEIVALKREVEGIAISKGYRLEIISMIQRPAPHIHGRTRFKDEKSIEIAIATDRSEELFNLSLGEELVHAWQNVSDYPKVRPRRTFLSADTQELADWTSTVILDIHAHRELRKRNISTKALGLETYENDKKGLLSQRPPPHVDAMTAKGKLWNALIYVRLYFELNEDPEIPEDLWKEVDQWFADYLPKTRDFAVELVGVVKAEGLEDRMSVMRILRRLMAPFDFRSYFEIFGGPPSNPAYVEPLPQP